MKNKCNRHYYIFQKNVQNGEMKSMFESILRWFYLHEYFRMTCFILRMQFLQCESFPLYLMSYYFFHLVHVFIECI